MLPREYEEEDHDKRAVPRLVGGAMILVGVLVGWTWIPGGIWLVFIGEWRLIVAGVFVMLVAPIAFGLALAIPGLLFAVPGIAALGRDNRALGYPLLFLGSLCDQALLMGWAFVTLRFVASRSGENLLPALLWSPLLALGPWVFMSEKGGDEAVASWLSIAVASLVYFGAAVAYYFVAADWEVIALAFGGGGLVAALMCARMFTRVMREGNPWASQP